MATSGFQAGLDASDVRVSFEREATYKTDPSIPFKFMRLLNESLASSKTRTRPQEIKSDGQAAHALTTQIEATGDISIGLSAAGGSNDHYDDWLLGMINRDDFTAAVSVTGTDIEAFDDTPGVESSGNPGFTSGTTDKFNALRVGDWVKASGFTAAAVNGIFRVVSVTTGASAALQLTGPGSADIVDESAGANVTIRNDGQARNGVDVNTMQVEKELTPDGAGSPLFLLYTGVYISGGSLSMQLGGFVEGTFSLLAADEALGTSTASTGTRVAAPTGRVIDTVSGVQQAGFDDELFEASNPPGFDSVLQSLTLNFTKENARTQFGIGSSVGKGIGRGTLVVDGTASIYFRNRFLYDLFTAESDHVLSFAALDNLNQGYFFSMPAVTLMNPQIVAGGPDSDIVGEFTLEGNPGTFAATETPAATAFTIQIDKIL